MGFVDNPNLPNKSISRVIIGEDYVSELREALEERSIEVIACPLNGIVDPRLHSHIDLSVLHQGGNRLIVSEAVANEKFTSVLRELETAITFCKAPYGSNYPDDAGLCAAIIGEKVFHNRSLSVLSENQKLIDVRQGYAKCTTCVVSENAAITSDRGMARAMSDAGLDVLTICEGYISLDGYHNGFIGGSAFKIAKDKLAFTGTLDEHPDKGKIEQFLLANNVMPIYLTQNCIFDIGSAIPIM